MDLPGKKYSVVLTDPPWAYSAWSGKKTRTADAHYDTMTEDEIAKLPVASILEDNAAVFMWSTPPMFDTQVQVLRAWGLRYVTIAFNWVKLSKKHMKNADAIKARSEGETLIFHKGHWYRQHFGMGHYTRANSEFCLLALKGKMPVDSKSIRQLLFAPLREHSRKPDEQWTKIDKLYSTGNRLEMFARPSMQRPANWDVWGLEAK
jgi:N6-adenosine-specific RNA methylase IME4